MGPRARGGWPFVPRTEEIPMRGKGVYRGTSLTHRLWRAVRGVVACGVVFSAIPCLADDGGALDNLGHGRYPSAVLDTLNANGVLRTVTVDGSPLDDRNPFFQSLGTNG